LFTLLLAVALIAAGLWFRRDAIRFAEYTVTTTSSVSGLKSEAAVRYRGVDVGRVESIKIEPGSSGRIHIRIGVQEDTPITRSTYAQPGYQGVTGLAFVALNDDGNRPSRSRAPPMSRRYRDTRRPRLRPRPSCRGEELGPHERAAERRQPQNVTKMLVGFERASR
jgi:phospholipid/cholesterol/gamma-HCH transport system substrate-binding protein